MFQQLLQRRQLMMLQLYLQLYLLLVLLASATAAAIEPTSSSSIQETMTMEGQLQYFNKIPYNNITATIIVNHGEYTTYSRMNTGNFTIHNIVPGIYVIDIVSPTHHFSQIKCLYKSKDELLLSASAASTTGNEKASTKQQQQFSCLLYHYPGARKQTLGLSIDTESNHVYFTVSALAYIEYFENKRGFNISSIYKNPMIIMMIFTIGMMYLLPKMMENMDPEERAMMQKQMQQQQNPQQLLNSFFNSGGGDGDSSNEVGTMAFSSSSSTSVPVVPATANNKPSSSKKYRK